MRIRKARHNDVSAIQKIAATELKLDFVGFRLHWPTTIKEAVSGGRYFVAVSEKGIIGIMCVTPHARYVEIDTLAVRGDHKRRGVGEALISFIKEKAKKSGLKFISVGSFYEYRALGFYKKLGFTREDRGSWRGHPYHYLEYRSA
ncbi:MAG: GNAT family N-acetyltransferase [Patescibacteria group bacterium]